MAQVIDALIISLGLDPKGFDEGQRKAIESLRDFERGAGRQVRSIEGTFGSSFKSISGFIYGLEAPLVLLRRHLEATVTQSSQTTQHLSKMGETGTKAGGTIHEGMLAGGRAMTVLAGTALVALAAITALTAAVKAFKGVSEDIYGVKVAAGGAGISPERMSAIATALHIEGQIPKDETYKNVEALGQIVERAKAGNQEALAAFGKLHVNPFQPADTLLRDIAASMGKMSEQTAVERGGELGWTDVFSEGLQRVGADFEKDVAKWQHLAITHEQVEASMRFNKAMAELEDTFTHLWQTLFVDVEPALEDIIEFFEKLGNVFQKTLETDSDMADAFKKGDWYRFFFGGPKTGDKTSEDIGGTGEGISWDQIRPYIEHLENASGDPKAINPIMTSSGHAEGVLQITTGTWKDFAPIDVFDKWNTPKDAPVDVQRQMGNIIYNSPGGPQRWPTYPQALRDYYRDHPDAPGAYKQTSQPQGDSSWGKTMGEDDLNWLDKLRKSLWGPDYDKDPPKDDIKTPPLLPRSGALSPSTILGSIRAGTGQTTGSASVSNDNSVTLGDINVYAQTNDPQKIAQAMQDSIQRNLSAARAGTGLS